MVVGAKAWAVVEAGRIRVGSVAISRRGAIVGWLRNKVVIDASATDSDVDRLWDSEKGCDDVVMEVRIEPLSASAG